VQKSGLKGSGTSDRVLHPPTTYSSHSDLIVHQTVNVGNKTNAVLPTQQHMERLWSNHTDVFRLYTACV